MTSTHSQSRWLQQIIGWIPAVSLMIAIFILSSRDAPEFMRHKLFDLQDKAAHAFAYYVLSISFLRALLWHVSLPASQARESDSRDPRNKTTGTPISWGILVLAIGLAALYGATDEWHQSFVPSRTAAVDDWLADAVGASLLLFTQRWIIRLLEWEKKLWHLAAGFRSA